MRIRFLQHPGLVAYLTAGDPSLTTTRDIAPALLDNGADGPVVQRASQRAARKRLTHPPRLLTLKPMEVQLTPNLQLKLTRMAEQQGRSSAALIIEAVERLVNYDAWFTSEVEKGLAAADRGELTDHQAVRAMIDSRYPA